MLFIAKSDIGQFWEEYKSYFSTEQNRKSGDILLSMINQKKLTLVKIMNIRYICYLKEIKKNFTKLFCEYMW